MPASTGAGPGTGTLRAPRLRRPVTAGSGAAPALAPGRGNVHNRVRRNRAWRGPNETRNGSKTLPHRQKGRVASPVSQSAHHARFAPVARLASSVRRQLGPGGLSVWLLKAAVRHAARRKSRARSRHDPDAWRSMWEGRNGASWPAEPVTGIIEAGGTRLVIDRCEITSGGHLWLDGWVLGTAPEAVRLEAQHCAIEWQSAFATPRPDVVQTLKLSLVGREAHVGVQILARIAGHVPGRSRLALTVGEAGAATLVVPAVPRIERSSIMWQSVYDAMRHRGQRDVAYLETSVGLLQELRKVDWRERNASICQAIDEAMRDARRLKVLVLSRLHPNVAYLNLHMLAAARGEPAEFIVCSMGQTAIQRANEYRTNFAQIGAHDVRFVSAEAATPSCELIEQFMRSCQSRGAPGLVVYDDVAVAGAMGSLGEALNDKTGHNKATIAWPRQFPHAGPDAIPFAEPLAADDRAGPYWRSAKSMEHGGLGALLFESAGLDIPSIPPFEGRGYGLEYLLASALPGAELAGDTMLDLVDPAGQREAQGLDMLMLLASRGVRP
jgi:hypothetical protein